MQRFIDKSVRNGCTKLKENKIKAPYNTRNYMLAVYKNGELVSVERTKKAVLRFCEEHSEPDTVFHVRLYGKLVYFSAYNEEPIFFNGFHISSWHCKPYEKALIDYDGHTSKETTEKYDLLTRALEETASKNKDK